MTVPVNISVEPAARPLIDALASAIPVIETERLILLLPRLADWPALEPIWTTGRGRFIGGPMTGQDAWLDFSQCVSSWLLRGFGWLTVTRKSDRAVLGLVGYAQEYGDPEPELGWLLTEAAEGQGYATEAARAMLPLGHDLIGPGRFVSYVDSANRRSRRLAERLGAILDDKPHPLATGCLVYRHHREHRQ